MQTLVIISGILLGAISIGSATWIWHQKQVFGIGGCVLSAVGVMLIGLSIWKNLELSADKDGVKLKFDSLREVAEVAQAIDAKTLDKKSGNKHAGLTLVCPATAAGLAFCASLGQKLDLELIKIKETNSDDAIRKISSIPVKVVTLNEEFMIVPSSIIKTLTTTQIPSNEIAKIARETSGISVKQLKDHGILGGPNSETNKALQSIQKSLRF
jgi:hypothetical protein